MGMDPLDGPLAVVRVDPASGFKALRGDQVLNIKILNCVRLGRGQKHQ